MYTTNGKCPVCDEIIFGGTLYKAKTKKFCSWECFRKNNVATHKSDNKCPCGQLIIKRTSYEVKLAKFCNRKCRVKYFQHSQEVIERIRKTKTGVSMHSEATKKASRKRMLGNKYALGNKLTEKHIQAIINAHKGDKSHFYKDGRCEDPKYISWLSTIYQERKRNAEGSHTFKEWQKVKEEHNFTCNGCKKQEPEIKLTEDHIIPLSKGGSDFIENIQPLCKVCNCKKHAKLPIKSK